MRFYFLCGLLLAAPLESLAAQTLSQTPAPTANDRNSGDDQKSDDNKQKEILKEILKEIIVTARKSQERLQDVPLSISSYDAEEIARLGIFDLRDVARLDPSLIYDQGVGAEATLLTIRGLKPTRGRQNVAMLIDNIDVTTESLFFSGGSTVSLNRMLDIVQVDVIKGPQTPLSSRNAFGGAIALTTRDPAFHGVEGDFAIGFGRFNDMTLSGSISAPESKHFAWRLSASFWKHDGAWRSTTDDKTGGGQGQMVAATLKWQKARNFIKLRLDYSKDHFDQPAAAVIRANTALTAPNPFRGGQDTTGYYYFGAVGEQEDHPDLTPNYSLNPYTNKAYDGVRRQVFHNFLTGEWVWGVNRIQTWTGFTWARSINSYDGDYDALLNAQGQDTALRSNVSGNRDTLTQISQEIRFSRRLSDSLEATVGGLYWYENAKQKQESVAYWCFPSFFNCPPGQSANSLVSAVSIEERAFARKTRNLSAYMAVHYDVSDKIRISANGRYSHEKETTSGPVCALATTPNCLDPTFPAMFGVFQVPTPFSTYLYAPVMPPSTSQSTVTKSDYLTGRILVQYRPDDRRNLYASVTRSVKPGGVSTVNSGDWFDGKNGDPRTYAYGQEGLWSYEVGAKLLWLSGRLQTNLALFRQQYKGKQVNGILIDEQGFQFSRVFNAGNARVYGLEAEVSWVPVKPVLVTANYTYLDGKYTNFSYTTNSILTAIRAHEGCNSDPSGQLCVINLDGKRLEGAPKHSLSLTGRYQKPLTAKLTGFVEIAAQVQSKRYIDYFNNDWLDPTSIADMRIGIEAQHWSLLFAVSNITDNRTIRTANSHQGYIDITRYDPDSSSATYALKVNMPIPRTWKIRFSYKFF